MLTSKKSAKKIRRKAKNYIFEKAFQLRFTKSRSCNVILYISFKPPIKTMNNGSQYVLVSETANEMLTDVRNYDEVYHKHTKKCSFEK